MSENKFKITEGHKNDMWFIQQKSLINKRFEIVSIHYSKVKAETEMKLRAKD